MIDFSKIIKEVASKEMSPLLVISEQGYKQKYDFIIDCADIQDYNTINIISSIEHKDLFTQLVKIKGPVVYIFEIISSTNSNDIVENIKNYSKTEKSKKTPAIKVIYPDTNILYIGKVKRNFWGRVIQHLGFYKISQTQGLQLYYWAKPLKLKLLLHVFEFNNDSVELLPVLEKGLALELKPILGKHPKVAN